MYKKKVGFTGKKGIRTIRTEPRQIVTRMCRNVSPKSKTLIFKYVNSFLNCAGVKRNIRQIHFLRRNGYWNNMLQKEKKIFFEMVFDVEIIVFKIIDNLTYTSSFRTFQIPVICWPQFRAFEV